MSNLPDHFQRPPDLAVADWLLSLGQRLLNNTRLLIDGKPHRLAEVEAYYHSADHPDPFSHRDPVQREYGRWYFHRTGGVYRSGSFKGLDITFGDGNAYGGILFRSLETPDGKLINGPSLLVDHLLKEAGHGTVAALDRAIANRLAWETKNVIRLDKVDEESRPVFATARVGLSLKRTPPTPTNVGYLLMPYRYLTEPQQIAKGKLLLVLALHRKGYSEAAIKEQTGCPITAIRRHLAAYRELTPDVTGTEFAGKVLGPRDLCLLHALGERDCL